MRITFHLVVCETGHRYAALLGMIYLKICKEQNVEEAENAVQNVNNQMIFGEKYRNILLNT